MAIFIIKLLIPSSQAMNDDYPNSINWITVWSLNVWTQEIFFSLDFYSLIRHYYHNPFNLLLCYVVESQSAIPSSLSLPSMFSLQKIRKLLRHARTLAKTQAKWKWHFSSPFLFENSNYQFDIIGILSCDVMIIRGVHKQLQLQPKKHTNTFTLKAYTKQTSLWFRRLRSLQDLTLLKVCHAY